MTPSFRRIPGRVAILYGAIAADASPDEQDTLTQVHYIQSLLTQLGYTAVAVPMTLDLEEVRARLLGLRPAFVFNLVESLDGQGRLIYLAQALLDSLRLPYSGAEADACYLTSQKPLAKRMMMLAGLPTPPWLMVNRAMLASSQDANLALIAPFPGPYIVKSVWEHASIGLDDSSIVRDPKKLLPLLRKRQKQYGGDWFVEQYIEGREFNLALLEDKGEAEVLPIAEILFTNYPPEKAKIVDYRAKWHEDSFEYRNTQRHYGAADEDQPLYDTLAQLARDCWRLFSAKGYARVDFRVDASGQAWILEVNVNPCLSPDAGFIAATQRAGLSSLQTLLRILSSMPGGLPAIARRPSPMPLFQRSEPAA